MEEPNHLIRTVESMFEVEPRPVLAGLVNIPSCGDTPIEQAFRGLSLAINAVVEADHRAHLRGWGDRRDRLLEWRAHLAANPIPDEPEAACATGDVSLTQALMGTERWEEMFDDLAEMMQWASNQQVEAARKLAVLHEVTNRAPGVLRRGSERVSQVRRSAQRKLKKLAAGDAAGRRRIIEAGQREVQTISAVAVKRMDGLTRQVLDLDETTATVETLDWLHRHGLDTTPHE